MASVSFEQIPLLLIFVLLPVIHVLMQRAKKPDEEREARERSLEARRREQPAPRTFAPRPRAPQIPVSFSEGLKLSAPPPISRVGTRSLWRSKRDLRRAIILMTVLGRCRALEPPY